VIRFVSRHRKLVAGLAIVALAALVFVLAYFQPQKLFINKTVNEAAPSAPAPAASGASTPTTLGGSFRSFEHPTNGRAVVLDSGGRQVLRFENFRTSNGPDVVVYLSAAAPRSVGDAAVVRDFVDLGSLKGNIGDQNYTIPSGTDLARYSNVVVWCRRFKVAFGAAKLS
jgi:hypothetical protein